MNGNTWMVAVLCGLMLQNAPCWTFWIASPRSAGCKHLAEVASEYLEAANNGHEDIMRFLSMRAIGIDVLDRAQVSRLVCSIYDSQTVVDVLDSLEREGTTRTMVHFAYDYAVSMYQMMMGGRFHAHAYPGMREEDYDFAKALQEFSVNVKGVGLMDLDPEGVNSLTEFLRSIGPMGRPPHAETDVPVELIPEADRYSRLREAVSDVLKAAPGMDRGEYWPHIVSIGSAFSGGTVNLEDETWVDETLHSILDIRDISDLYDFLRPYIWATAPHLYLQFHEEAMEMFRYQNALAIVAVQEAYEAGQPLPENTYLNPEDAYFGERLADARRNIAMYEALVESGLSNLQCNTCILHVTALLALHNNA